MTTDKLNLIQNGRLNLDALITTSLTRPPMFEAGAPLFWNDPYISGQMLLAHLNPDLDAASRKPQTIDRTVNWLAKQMNLQPGQHLLDLGCGPGLYSTHFAALGLQVVGIDYSRRSINYAQQQAREHNQSIEYIYQNYQDMNFSNRFAAVILIYGDFCTLTDSARDIVLARINKALKPGGFFAFDVMTPVYHERNQDLTSWAVEKQGFWRPEPYLVLNQKFDYPEEEVYLDRHLVIEESGAVTDYRIWNRLYNLERLRILLGEFGFEVQEKWSDLTGEPYDPNAQWLGMLARKV